MSHLTAKLHTTSCESDLNLEATLDPSDDQLQFKLVATFVCNEVISIYTESTSIHTALTSIYTEPTSIYTEAISIYRHLSIYRQFLVT